MLLGVLKGLIHRAHILCDMKEDLLEELALLRNVFVSNGYPDKLVLKTLEESWANETLKAPCDASWDQAGSESGRKKGIF